MAAEIKYSVIIPVYNAEKTLERCLKSLTGQKRQDVELIVVNDGSTDGSEAIIHKFESLECKLVYLTQENSGVSRARNRGLDNASGKYITFVDSDDFVSRNYFAELDKMEKEDDSDLWVFANKTEGGKQEDESALFQSLKECSDIISILSILLSSRKIMPPWNKRFKREIIETNHLRFIENMQIGEDFNFCLAYALQSNSVSINLNKLYCVNISDMNSLSRKYRPNLDEQIMENYDYAEKTVNDSSYGNKEKQSLLMRMDYLFAKNVFSCVSETFKNKRPNYITDRAEYMRIGKMFKRVIGDGKSYCNIVHVVLRRLLKHDCIFPIFAVSYLVKWRAFKKYVRN